MFASGMRPTFWTYVLVLALLSKICKLEKFTFQKVKGYQGLGGDISQFEVYHRAQRVFLGCVFFSVEFDGDSIPEVITSLLPLSLLTTKCFTA